MNDEGMTSGDYEFTIAEVLEANKVGGMLFFKTSQGGSCDRERSYGTWQIRLTGPNGTARTGSIRIVTDRPNTLVHGATTECYDWAADMKCGGGHDSQFLRFGGVPTPPVHLGPR